jgi:hypothetical protein
MFRYARLLLLCLLLSLIVAAPIRSAQQSSIQLTVHWHKVIRVSRTSPSLLYIATPNSKRGAPLHDPMLRAIRELGANYVRYSPCNDYPHLTIAELQPPGKHSTSWDFSNVDPMTEDAVAAIGRYPFIMNFSTIPEWMFKTLAPVLYPADPDQLFFNYEQGTELRDPTYRQVADYYARVVSWYVKGGFTDELGKWQASGHHYKIAYWEVLNEPNIEHNLSPQTYTGIYDAVVEAIHKVSPRTKFIGMVNSYPPTNSEFFEYFLDPKHHKPGIPLDAVSFHFYAGSEDGTEPLKDYPFTFFAQADEFLAVVSYIDTMRQQLSPSTRLMADEIGTGLPDDGPQWKPTYASIPAYYWNLSAALYAYVFAELAVRGVNVVNESMMPAYVGQFPDLALLNWQTGQPNARFTVLKLLRDNFRPGDMITEASATSGYVMAQGFVSPSGQRKVLLVNKSDKDFQVNFSEAPGATLKVIDLSTSSTRPPEEPLKTSTFKLGGFGVAALTLKK